MTAPKYTQGLLGRKIGMTQVFAEDGTALPVTVIEVGPCTVLDVRNQTEAGYSAVQFGFAPKKTQRVNKPLMGHFARTGKGAFDHVKEIRCDIQKLGWNELGKEVKVEEVFIANELVDISGVSKGRGFQGVIRRHHMKGFPATRGTHEYERHAGSIGMRKTPGRVWKGKRMPGHMGNEMSTIQNLQIVAVRPEENVLLVKGCVPGANGAFLVVRKAISTAKAAA